MLKVIIPSYSAFVEVLGQARWTCGTHRYPPTTGTYLVSAIVLALGLLVAMGTALDLVSRLGG